MTENAEDKTPSEGEIVANSDNVKNFNFDELRKSLDLIDEDRSFDYASHVPNESDQSTFQKQLLDIIGEPNETKRAVLGVDIYKYSQYDYNPQKLIPFIFFLLRQKATRNFFSCEKFFSNRYTPEQLETELINTGDGGYLFFKYPIDAIIFLLYFNSQIHLFNSYHFYPNLRKYVGPLTLRYTITYDRVYKIESKFYGPGIIRNARIISKDSLNRFLIDNKTYDWFLLNTNGIENLPFLERKDLYHLDDKSNANDSLLLNKYPNQGVINVSCQKLDNILVKNNQFNVYNLIIQSHLTFSSIYDQNQKTSITTTIGNMNCNGI